MDHDAIVSKAGRSREVLQTYTEENNEYVSVLDHAVRVLENCRICLKRPGGLT